MIIFVRFLLGFMLVFTALFLILLVLVQRGRGGWLAGALGGMGGQSAFGAKAGDVFTKITIGVAAFLTFTRTQGALWPLFGAANQLLASLTLLAITVWLAKSGKDNGFLKYPMYFMFCVTLTALGLMVYNNFTGEPRNLTLVVFSLILLAVAITLVANAAKSLRSATKTD